MKKNFKIQNIILNVNTNNFLKNNLNIKSFPRNYNVEINNSYKKLIDLINKKDSIIIIDKNIFDKYVSKKTIKNKKIIKIEAKEKYNVGDRYKGRVTNIADYGAFVELEGGIEGLVHVSEMSWVSKIQNPNKYVLKTKK